MGIIYIGDRATGKTHLALELANPNSEYARVITPDYNQLKSMSYDEEQAGTKPTDAAEAVYAEYLEIQVKLPIGLKKLTLDWIDTPGEIWRQTWQAENPDKWENFLENIRQAQGILLIVSPYREMLKSGVENAEEYITQKQWCNRFQRWVNFFHQDCPKVRHLVLCLNKADLFCDLKQESQRLAYHPHNSSMNWKQRHDYVFQRYFRPVNGELDRLNRSISGLSVRCFITSIYNRSLLELPWIYLGSFLGK